MVEKVVEKFDVKYLQILDENGNVDESLFPKISVEQIKKMYEFMVLIRIFDETALSLQREGRILTYAPLRGQEAVQVGSAFAMEKEDWVFPTYRDNGVYIVRGFPMKMLYQYWAGDERGMAIPEGINIFTVCIPVSTQISHAVGFAWAEKMKRGKSVVFVYFGDGATSKGDFYESLNFAGVFKVPLVGICQNNQWAISVPRSRQSAAKTLAQKAIAFGFNGIQVDGNDIFAVYKAVREAREKALSGEPTIIECVTYRISDHTTADDARRYRTEQEVNEWKKKDPIDRLEKYMMNKGILNEKEKEVIKKEAEEKVMKAVNEAESVPPPKFEDIFNYTFESLPKRLIKQMKM
jgi:pyruvate dehydrogenase E1 component alpha subunit